MRGRRVAKPWWASGNPAGSDGRCRGWYTPTRAPRNLGPIRARARPSCGAFAPWRAAAAASATLWSLFVVSSAVSAVIEGETMRKLLLLSLCLLAAPAFAQGCPPQGQSKASLQALKALQFTLPDAAEKRTLADGLIACLADPDPEVRDGIAYEALTKWMRAGDFDADALRGLRDKLYAMLDADDKPGFARPFAALVLSEVARTDRVKPWMTPEERGAMVDRAATYVESVRDYRGYINGEGWRHGVA